MQQSAELRTNWKMLAPLLLACPLVLAICLIVLPQHTSLYGSPYERVFLYSILALPFVGVAAIAKLLYGSRLFVVGAAIGYLCVTMLLVVATAIFVGCSWARVCF